MTVVFAAPVFEPRVPWLKELSGLFKDLPNIVFPLLSTEVRGVEALRLIGQQIWKPTSASQKRAGRRSQPQRAGTFDMERHGEFVFAKRRIWIFGGKVALERPQQLQQPRCL
jgi:hypothetical protein